MVTGTPRMITDGLVLYIDDANTKSYPGSGTNWVDLSPSAASASLINGPTFTTNANGSIWFDNTNDYVPTNHFQTYQRITLASWVYPMVQTAYESYLISKSYFYATSTNSWPASLSVAASATMSYFFVSNGSTFQLATGGAIISGSVSKNTWNYVVGTYDGSNIRMYVNGVQMGITAYTGIINYSGSLSLPWTIGRSAGQFGGGVGLTYSTGSIAIASIYNRALSASEVLQNYEATRERFGV
jgi:hypothetical protein